MQPHASVKPAFSALLLAGLLCAACSEESANESEVRKRSAPLPSESETAEALSLLRSGVAWPGLRQVAVTSDEATVLAWYAVLSSHVVNNLVQEAEQASIELSSYLETDLFAETIRGEMQTLFAADLTEVGLFERSMLLMERASHLPLVGTDLFQKAETLANKNFAALNIPAASTPTWLSPQVRHGASRFPQRSEPAIQTLEELETMLSELRAQETIDKDTIKAMSMRLNALAAYPERRPIAVALARGFAAILRREKNYAATAEAWEGTARRIDLPGNPMQITGTHLDGTPFDASTVEGHVVIVDIWATYCPPCINAMPHLREAYTRWESRGLRIVGISLDESADTVQRYLDRRPATEKISWIMLNDGPRNPTASYYAIEGIPFVALIGRDGRVIQTYDGGGQHEALMAELKKLFR